MSGKIHMGADLSWGTCGVEQFERGTKMFGRFRQYLAAIQS
jgi:hypothetical protein